MNWNSDSFGFTVPGDLLVPLASHFGYEWNTLSRTFQFPEPKSGGEALSWLSQFGKEETEKLSMAVKLICSPELVTDIMHVRDDIVALYRVTVGDKGMESPVLQISEVEGHYSCSLKKNKAVLYEELIEVINPEHPYWETTFSFQATRKEYMVLNALMDLNQRYRYSALLEQRPYDRKLRISDLERTLEVSASRPDWRWMTPFVMSSTPRLGEAPVGKELVDVLVSLAKSGFIYMDDDQTQVALSESGNFYYSSISRRYSVLNINRISYDIAGNHVGEGAMFISTDKFLWTLDLGWLEEDMITLSSLKESIVEEIIEDMFMPTGKPSKADSPRIKREAAKAPEATRQDISTMYCRQCGKQIPSNSKFCKYCGAKLK